jgi:hypothetical protein
MCFTKFSPATTLLSSLLFLLLFYSEITAQKTTTTTMSIQKDMCYTYVNLEHNKNPEYGIQTNISACDNFANWSDLNTFIKQNSYNMSAWLAIKPRSPITLTVELDFAGISKAITQYNQYYLFGYFIFILQVAGIQVYPFTGSSRSLNCSQVSLVIMQSQIAFYINNSIAFDCSKALIPSPPGNLQPFAFTLFNSFKSAIFATKNKYPAQPICPYIFVNATCEIQFENQIDTLLIVNLVKFQAIHETNSIGSSIKSLAIHGFGYTLDTNLAHPLVFKQLELVLIEQSIAAIQTDLFKHFKFINMISFTLDNYKNFFHKIGIEWTRSITALKRILIIFAWNSNDEITGNNWFNGLVYSFPDEDFCIFARWPKTNASFYLNGFEHLIECSFIIQWLTLGFPGCDNKPAILTADFEKRVNRCAINNYNGPTTVYAEYYQVEFIVEFIQDLIEFVAIPCACLLGFFLNYSVVWRVNKYKEKELKDTMYECMSLNAKFNCAYCVIFLFYPINSCVDRLTTSGLFCSTIRTSYITQLYKIIFVAYFGESIKMCANIFYILMAVNRYILIGREHNPTLETISKWDIKWVLRIYQ